MTDIDNIKLYLNDIEFKNNYTSDCGGMGFEWFCPDCGERIIYAPSMWWRMECSCRTWNFEMIITGEKKDKKEEK